MAEPGFIGLSGGEVAAAYGAGILSREEAVETICWIATCLRHPTGRCHSFQIDGGERKARWLCRTAPRPLEFGGEIIPGISHVLSEPEDCADNRAFLEARTAIQAEYSKSVRYHVPEMGVDEQRFAESVPFTAARTDHSPLYLCSFGGRVPAGYPFDWKHWAWMVSSPYRMGAASAAAYDQGFNRVIVAGSGAIGGWHAQTGRRMNRQALVIDGFAAGSETESPWTAICGQLDPRILKAATPAAPRSPVEAGGLDLSDPEHLADPYGAYESLRREGPVHYLPRHGFWLVLGYEEMRTACSMPGVFSNSPYDRVDAVLIGEDPPRHAAVRRMISRHFDSATIRRLESFAGSLAESLLKPRFDVVGEYAAPFAHNIAANLLGLDEAGLAEVLSASEEARDEPKPFPAITRSLDRLACRADAYRRINEAAGESLGDPEVRSLVRFLWLAAITTTERVIARAAMRLLDHRDVLDELRRDRRLVGAFIEEVLRLDAPEHMLPRRTTSGVVLGGTAIPAGAEVQLCTTAANRDPAVFDDPGAFRLDREARHLSFGTGVHHCSGTALARRVIPLAVEALVRSPGLRAIQPRETIDYFATITTRVPKSFVVGT